MYILLNRGEFIRAPVVYGVSEIYYLCIQVLLVTDGNGGTGDSSLKASLLKQANDAQVTTMVPNTDEAFPLPFQFPCKLHVMCVAPPTDKALARSLPYYQKLVELNNNRGEVFTPEGNLTAKSVEGMFKKMCSEYFTPFTGTLKCGNLTCGVQVFPAPDTYDK